MKPQYRIPLHVSGFWAPRITSDPLYSGSIGAGLNLDVYLEAFNEGSDSCHIVYNGMHVLEEQARETCRVIGRVGINATSPFKLSWGYALSAALLIAHSLAAHSVYRGSYILEKALELPHILEVKYKTGLGDVLAIYTGGFEIRAEHGAPGIGRAYRVIPSEKPCIVTAELPGGEDTPRMLSRIPSSEYGVVDEYTRSLFSNPSLELFFNYSQSFTRRIFDYSLIDEALGDLENSVHGYYRKKNVLIIWARRDRAGEVSGKLRRYGLKPYTTSINYSGIIIEDPAQPST